MQKNSEWTTKEKIYKIVYIFNPCKREKANVSIYEDNTDLIAQLIRYQKMFDTYFGAFLSWIIYKIISTDRQDAYLTKVDDSNRNVISLRVVY